MSRQQGLQFSPSLVRPPPPRLQRPRELSDLQLGHRQALLQVLLVRRRLHSREKWARQQTWDCKGSTAGRASSGGSSSSSHHGSPYTAHVLRLLLRHDTPMVSLLHRHRQPVRFCHRRCRSGLLGALHGQQLSAQSGQGAPLARQRLLGPVHLLRCRLRGALRLQASGRPLEAQLPAGFNVSCFEALPPVDHWAACRGGGRRCFSRPCCRSFSLAQLLASIGGCWQAG